MSKFDLTHMTKALLALEKEVIEFFVEKDDKSVEGVALTYSFFLSNISQLFASCAACIAFIDKEDGQFDRIYAHGYGTDFKWQHVISTGGGLLSEALRLKKIKIDTNVSLSKNYLPLCPNTISQISIPLFDTKNTLFAGLVIEFDCALEFYIESDIKELQANIITTIMSIDDFIFARRADEISAIVSKIIHSDDDFPIFQHIISSIEMISGRGEVAILRRKGGDLIVREYSNINEETIPRDLRIVIESGAGYTCYVAHTREPFYCKDTLNRAMYPYYRSVVDDTRSQFTVPLIFRNELVGVLNVGAIIPFAFSLRDRQLISGVAQHAASALFYRDAIKAIMRISHSAMQILKSVYFTQKRNSLPLAVTDAIDGSFQLLDDGVYQFKPRRRSSINLADYFSFFIAEVGTLTQITDFRLVNHLRNGSDVSIDRRHLTDIAEILLSLAVNVSDNQSSIPITFKLDERIFHGVSYIIISMQTAGSLSNITSGSTDEIIDLLLSPGNTMLKSYRLMIGDQRGGQRVSRGHSLWALDQVMAGYGGYVKVAEPADDQVIAEVFFRQ